MKIILLVTILFLLEACKTTEMVRLMQNKHGSYCTFYRYATPNKGAAVIFGRIRTEDADNPTAALYVDRNMHITDSTGGYKIVLAPGKYRFAASTLSYNPMKLEPVDLKAGDSIRADFFLTGDTTSHW